METQSKKVGTMSAMLAEKYEGCEVTIFKAGKGSFVGLRGYSNEYGELSNVLFHANVSYEEMKRKDIVTLQAANLSEFEGEYSLDELEIAKVAIIKSLTAPERKRSEGQKNAYVNLGNGMRRHVESNYLYIWGQVEFKKVIVKGEYPIVNSRRETLCKRFLSKVLELRTSKFRNYKVGNISEIAINGTIIEI